MKIDGLRSKLGFLVRDVLRNIISWSWGHKHSTIGQGLQKCDLKVKPGNSRDLGKGLALD